MLLLDYFMLKYEVEGVEVGGRLKSPTTKKSPALLVLIFDKYPDLKITRQQLKKLFELAIYGKRFLFDGDYYVQIVGDALGCALGSLLANLLMGFHKERCSDQFQFYDSNWIK